MRQEQKLNYNIIKIVMRSWANKLVRKTIIKVMAKVFVLQRKNELYFEATQFTQLWAPESATKTMKIVFQKR